MTRFQLTNDQRRYFGLEPIPSHWEMVPLKGDTYREESILYFEGNTIKRYIISTEKQYEECQYDELTEDRKLLLPVTTKGKAKKLSASVLEQRQPTGIYLSVDGFGDLRIGNHNSQTTFYATRWEKAPSKNAVPIQETVAKFIANSPSSHLDAIEKFKTVKRRHIKFKSGDYFSFKINRSAYGFGRILLDVGKARKKKLLPETHGLFFMMMHPVIVQFFVYQSSNPFVDIHILDQQPTLPSDVVADNILLYGEYDIIGHKELKDEEFEFPISYGKRLDRVPSVFLQWGLIHLELPLSRFDKFLQTEDSFGNPFGYYGIGFRPSYETIDIATTLGNGGVFNFDRCWHYKAKRDLRNPKHAQIRSEILAAFGLDPSKSYLENSLITHSPMPSAFVRQLK